MTTIESGFASDVPLVPVSCSLNSVTIGGRVIDLAIQFFGDTPFVVVTEFQKIGSLFHVSVDGSVPGESSTSNYRTRVLMGHCKPETIAFCEILAREISLSSAHMICSVALKKETFDNANAIKEIIKFIAARFKDSRRPISCS